MEMLLLYLIYAIIILDKQAVNQGTYQIKANNSLVISLLLN